MGKRSNFARREKDLYDTPYEAVTPLINHLPKYNTYWEPCFGNGVLRDWLHSYGIQCAGHSDIEFDARNSLYPAGDMFITNPPWSRDVLHPIIENLRVQKPTWLLFDSDWMHTKQSKDLIKHCKMIVSVGRLKWIPDSPYTGKDNCCWYLFDNVDNANPVFYGRT